MNLLLDNHNQQLTSCSAPPPEADLLGLDTNNAASSNCNNTIISQTSAFEESKMTDNNNDNNNPLSPFDDEVPSWATGPLPQQSQDAFMNAGGRDLCKSDLSAAVDNVRKAGVAVVGGTMVGVGLVMIPLPTPFGVVVAGSGMQVLGSEFESVAKVNESIQQKVIDSYEAVVESKVGKTAIATAKAGKNAGMFVAQKSTQAFEYAKDSDVAKHAANGLDSAGKSIRQSLMSTTSSEDKYEKVAFCSDTQTRPEATAGTTIQTSQDSSSLAPVAESPIPATPVSPLPQRPGTLQSGGSVSPSSPSKQQLASAFDPLSPSQPATLTTSKPFWETVLPRWPEKKEDPPSTTASNEQEEEKGNDETEERRDQPDDLVAAKEIKPNPLESAWNAFTSVLQPHAKKSSPRSSFGFEETAPRSKSNPAQPWATI